MTDTPKRYQCRHIFTDGHRCGSPCLRREELCYYHHTTRRPVENPAQRRRRRSRFDLPLPDDRGSIQLSIGEVLHRIARNEIDPKRAGLLLYGLQIASLNLPRNAEPTRDSYPVEEVVTDPQLGTLAPRIEVGKAEIPEEHLGVVGQPPKRLGTKPEAKQKEEAPNPTEEILPTLQATEEGVKAVTAESDRFEGARLQPPASPLYCEVALATEDFLASN